MSELEALLWRSERPGQTSATAVLMMLDTEPEWERLRAAHDRATRRMPRMRERVLEPAVPVGTPAWIPDDGFDLDHHLRRVRRPAPAGEAGLLAVAEDAATTPLDRDRPLWQGTLVAGLPHGRAAYLLRMHRSLADVPLLPALLTRGRKQTPAVPVDCPEPEASRPGPRALALADVTRQAFALPLTTGRLLAAGARALTRPGAATEDALRLVVSLRRAVSRPVAGSPLFAGRAGTSWRFGLLECARDDLRAAAAAAGGSVTDAYLAALLGGLRAYHERHGIEPGLDGPDTGADRVVAEEQHHRTHRNHVRGVPLVVGDQFAVSVVDRVHLGEGHADPRPGRGTHRAGVGLGPASSLSSTCRRPVVRRPDPSPPAQRGRPSRDRAQGHDPGGTKGLSEPMVPPFGTARGPGDSPPPVGRRPTVEGREFAAPEETTCAGCGRYGSGPCSRRRRCCCWPAWRWPRPAPAPRPAGRGSPRR
ncbi:wax ester/triacylglycerol synthase domain-containing protein [Actinoplanes subtropicus]|uniref:wax ester/triacylglycerol synthase domain-containing protein n=1 Tax=Actinoplanes subtropicus TaxID=543632 RepID=UPI001FE222C3|nr:wax ester/triacylglycerol synthase domain-containing protein [Actinoplanes subtropicus]